jgi:protein-L-isoaspartate(D-aspartate) O-methyltransferase
LFEYLENHGVSRRVIEAMNKIYRRLFVPREFESSAYIDIPLPIGFGQTISAPHMVGLMCEYLELKDGDKVLEVGTGSGYNAAVMSLLVGESGWIYTVEKTPELAQQAIERINMLGLKNITVVTGDGKEGLESFAPFDKITVTCYAKQVPEKLIVQLKDNGIMIIPVGSEYIQKLKRIRKIKTKLFEEDLTYVRFVPMQ